MDREVADQENNSTSVEETPSTQTEVHQGHHLHSEIRWWEYYVAGMFK